MRDKARDLFSSLVVEPDYANFFCELRDIRDTLSLIYRVFCFSSSKFLISVNQKEKVKKKKLTFQTKKKEHKRLIKNFPFKEDFV